jgi:hypothetical protein
MPGLLSGSRLNSSAPSGFANITNVQFQLGPTPTTSTGYTLITNSASIATFVSSLGNLQFYKGNVYSNIENQNINFIGTGTGTVIVSGLVANTSTNTGVLVVNGGIGIGEGFYTGQDVYINKIRVGQGTGSVNNIVITGEQQYSSGRPDGENSIVIGYDALKGLSSAENTIAIGRGALTSGTSIINSIAIGDYAMPKSGIYPTLPVGNITGISLGTATIVTVPHHGISTGTLINISLVQGPTQFNGNNYLVSTLSTDTFRLYPKDDYGLMFPIDSTGFTNYITSGTVVEITRSDNNIALGNYTAPNFYNGQQNYFLGYNAARNFTTGSFNLFIGYDVSNNMYRGNNNISIFGKTLVDGQDNQIGIGAVFYYNGYGYTQINSDLGVGLGNDSTSTLSGSFQVSGGIGLTGSLYVGNNLNVTSTGTVVLSPTNNGTVRINPARAGFINNMSIGLTTPRDATFVTVTATSVLSTTATITGAIAATSTNTGALQVPNGGISTQGNIYSKDGNPEENYLLYTPRISSSTTVPTNPKIGDFWVNLTNGRYFQYINDGGNRIWIQIAQL